MLVWALLLVVALLLLSLVGLVSWSWNHPVRLQLGTRWVSFYRTSTDADIRDAPGWYTNGPFGVFAVPVPGDTGEFVSPYVVKWSL